MSNEHRKALAAAWERFGRAITEASEALERSGIEHDDVAFAEAHDYWAQMVTMGLRREYHDADGLKPFFHRIGLDTKIGFDNPDNIYHIAKIRPDETYRVTGTRGGAYFLECSVSTGFAGTSREPRIISKYDTTELDVADDGTIEMFVGGEERPGNWFPVGPDGESFLVRQVFGDWGDADAGFFRIERMGAEGVPAAPLSPENVARRIDRTAEFVEVAVRYWVDYTLDLYARIEPNSFEQPGLQGKELPHVNAARAFFCWGLWDLAPDEALLVEIDAINEGHLGHGYMGFHLNNFWLQSLDYVSRITSLNHRQVHIDADGRIRYVLAHTDPGVPNWMDIHAHPRGAMLFRFALTQQAPQPTARVIPLAEVRKSLPEGTPAVMPEMRRQQIARRQAHVWRRFRW